MKGPIAIGSYVGIQSSHGVGAAALGTELGEDWSRSGHSNDIMESAKESKPDTRKDTEEDETDDELVIEECESGGAIKEGSGLKEAEPAPELTGKFRKLFVWDKGRESVKSWT